jgi:hypothetical protein
LDQFFQWGLLVQLQCFRTLQVLADLQYQLGLLIQYNQLVL